MDVILNIQKSFMNIFKKYGNNKLSSSLIYSYSLLDSSDIKLLLIPFLVKFPNSNSGINKKFNNMISLSICFSILSINILYDLPHMLNNSHRNKKLSLDNMFGETITQLASFCLFIESSNVILNSDLDNRIKNFIICSIRKKTINSDYLINNLVFLDKSKSSKKKCLKMDYQEKIKQIICNNIISVMIFLKQKYNNKNIYDFVDLIINQFIFTKNNNINNNLNYKKNKKHMTQLIDENNNLNFMFDILELFKL